MKRLCLGFLFFFQLWITSPGWCSDAKPEIPLLNSSTPLGPDDLLDLALQHNPDYQKSIKNAELSAIGVRSAYGTLLPSLDVGYQVSENHYYLPTYVNPDGSVATISPVPQGASRTSSGWVSLHETFRLGGQQLYTIKNAKITGRINDLLVESSQNELSFGVRQNFYNTLALKQLLALTAQVLEQKQEQLRLAKARYEIGSVTELDVLQAEIDLGNQENAIITAENDYKLARVELNRVLGVNLQSQFELKEDFSIFAPQYSLDSLIQLALVLRPDSRLTQEQERYQSNLVKSQRGEFLPDLTASLTHSRSQNSGENVDFTFNPRNRNTSVSLSLSWNLFSGFLDKAQYEQSQVALKNSQYDRQTEALTVEKDVRSAYYSLVQTHDQARVMQQNRELASRQLALEQERYRLGATSQLNLRVAQVTYEQAEADYIANIFSFWSNLAALERAVGKRLH